MLKSQTLRKAARKLRQLRVTFLTQALGLPTREPQMVTVSARNGRRPIPVRCYDAED